MFLFSTLSSNVTCKYRDYQPIKREMFAPHVEFDLGLIRMFIFRGLHNSLSRFVSFFSSALLKKHI